MSTIDLAKLGPQTRTFQFDRAKIDEKARTVPVSFSSETPARQAFGWEILDHSPGAADLSRLQSGGSVLVEHDGRDLVGVVESARVENRKGRGILRFGQSARATEILRDVVSGVRRNVSIRYTVDKIKPEGTKDGEDLYRVLRWTALHVSLVADAADFSVGIGRNLQIQDSMRNNIQLTPDADGGGGGGAAAVQTERNRVSEIHQLNLIFARQYPAHTVRLAEMASRAIETGEVETAFQTRAFQMCSEAMPILNPTNPSFDWNAPTMNARGAAIGLSRSDLERYSIVRAIRQIASGKNLDGLEREASEGAERVYGKPAGGFWIPWDILAAPRAQQRNLVTNIFTAAGALVGTELLGGSLIELLRNNMVVMQMGARSLGGLQGNVSIPSQTGGATASWLSENATLTLTNQAVGQLSLTPHRLSAGTSYSKQLLAQSSIDIEQFVREDLMSVLAIEKDRAAIAGLGAAGEPLGIISTSNLSTTVTLTGSGTTITYANALSAELNLATSNAVLGAVGFVTTNLCRSNTKAAQRFTSTDSPVWTPDNKINGYSAMASSQVPSTTSMIFGNWNDLLIADWAGIDVVVDPYTLAAANQVRIILTVFSDVGIRHSKSFLISTT